MHLQAATVTWRESRRCPLRKFAKTIGLYANSTVLMKYISRAGEKRSQSFS